jgi:hypothetical protein
LIVDNDDALPPPPPPGAPGLPLLPHPSSSDATVTTEIACAQNSRRDVLGLFMQVRSDRRTGEDRRVLSSDVVILRGTRCTVLALIAWVAPEIAWRPCAGQRPLQVSLSPAVVPPGGIVRIDVTDPIGRSPRPCSVALPPLVRRPQSDVTALAGIDLDTRPGKYRFESGRMMLGMTACSSCRKR